MTQKEALEILKTGSNVFLTGEPGAGKTHVVNEYVSYLKKRKVSCAVTASTGIAATHIGGMTIHSWSGIGIKDELSKADLSRIAGSGYIAKKILKARVLVIDEISMIKPGTLFLVDSVCRRIKEEDEPFGGLQVVFVGDFFQLPPIYKKETELVVQETFLEEVKAIFAYDSLAWKKAEPVVCYLSEQHRQEDDGFLELLSAIRTNSIDNKHVESLQDRKMDRSLTPAEAPRLFSHNADVDRLNKTVLDKLSGEENEFLMDDFGHEVLASFLKKGCLSPEKLVLKVGASVIFTKNNPKEGFVNGTLGKVIDFDEFSGLPRVKVKDGRVLEVKKMEWVLEENGKEKAKVVQVPLRLAWAITVHKSQGMSLDEAVMDLSGVFEYGQGYVALSRVRSFSGLYILGFNEKTFLVHPDVLKKDEEFKKSSEEAERYIGGLKNKEKKSLFESFILSSGGKIISEKAEKIKAKTKSLSSTLKETLVFLKDKKSVSDIVKERAFSEGTIIKHIEELISLKEVSLKDISYLKKGGEKDFKEICGSFVKLKTLKLKPVFENLKEKYSYEKLKIARLMLSDEFKKENINDEKTAS